MSFREKKIVLLNGPKSSGKDHAAKYICSTFPNSKLDKFARILKEKTHALYGFHWRAWDYYEDCKDIPHEDFLGLTPRQAYIGVSENYFKPMYDDQIFGRLLAKELDKFDEELYAISDSGFVPEAEVLIDKYGRNNVLLIRIYREGYTFEGDSRNYIQLPQIPQIEITNRGDHTYTDDLGKVVFDWLAIKSRPAIVL